MTRQLLVCAVALALLGSCARVTPAASAQVSAPVSTSSPAASPSPASASDALDRLDARKPVPLLPMMANHQKQNMREHLEAVQQIVAALAIDDYPAIERAAGHIGFSEQMGQMCTHMGAGAPGFTEQALAFHHTADGIATAAHVRDRKKVLRELGVTLQTCTACHAAWKQQVVDESTWQTLTSSVPPMHMGPH